MFVLSQHQQMPVMSAQEARPQRLALMPDLARTSRGLYSVCDRESWCGIPHQSSQLFSTVSRTRFVYSLRLSL